MVRGGLSLCDLAGMGQRIPWQGETRTLYGNVAISVKGLPGALDPVP